MPNFAGALKGEIRRLARKEVRASVTPIRRLVTGLRKRVAQQRKTIAELERAVRRAGTKSRGAAEMRATDEKQIRFSPAWVKQHRKKLKMSRRAYAKLVGVSAQSIFGWETGRSRPRRKALESWRRLRGMGVRELNALPAAEERDGRTRRGRARKTRVAKRRRAARRGGMRRAAKKK